MAEAARIECRYCGKMCTIKVLKSTHGRTAPKCISLRWEKWIADNQYRGAGSYTALLAEAGLVKRVPLFVWYRTPIDAQGNMLDSWQDPRYVKTAEEHLVSFHPVTPVWAYELAKKLSTDQTLSRRLGFTKKRELITERHPVDHKVTYKGTHRGKVIAKVWQSCDKDKQLPMHLRVKIMAIAGRNELAREMIFDDPEAAGRIIKDVM